MNYSLTKRNYELEREREREIKICQIHHFMRKTEAALRIGCSLFLLRPFSLFFFRSLFCICFKLFISYSPFYFRPFKMLTLQPLLFLFTSWFEAKQNFVPTVQRKIQHISNIYRCTALHESVDHKKHLTLHKFQYVILSILNFRQYTILYLKI